MPLTVCTLQPRFDSLHHLFHMCVLSLRCQVSQSEALSMRALDIECVHLAIHMSVESAAAACATIHRAHVTERQVHVAAGARS